MFAPQRDEWLLTLEQMDPSVLAEHTSDVQEALCHTKANVRRNALEALGKFPPASITAHAAALRDMLSDTDNWGVQALAEELLAQCSSIAHPRDPQSPKNPEY
jgi:hypothetical protein